MSKVLLWPPIMNLKEIEVSNDQSLLEQLKKAGVSVQSDCGGHASCGKCVVKIHTGEDHLSPPEFKELKLLGNVFHLTKERLSCQTHIMGDVTIDISAHATQMNNLESQKIHESSGSSKINSQTNSKTLLKKGEQLKAEAMERSRQEVVEDGDKTMQDPDWFRHWEKKSKDEKEKPMGKRLDGNKRPRMFKTPEDDPKGSDDKTKKE
ncbi:MAG: (2Fe-2S)-binding protein [Bdellovibrio sp.]|nr:(2Fe-2S)-binding protein [Bdellovibrio sp.]